MVYEYILWFEVTMVYSFRMDIRHPIQYLLQYYFYLLLVYLILLAIDVLLQVVLVVIKYNFEHLLIWFVLDVDQWNYVGVLLECF